MTALRGDDHGRGFSAQTPRPDRVNQKRMGLWKVSALSFGFGLLLFSSAQARVGKEVFRKARNIIESGFSSPEASSRETAASGLAEVPFPDGETLLRRALKDESEYVRIAASLSLARQKDISGTLVLQDILENTPSPAGNNAILVQLQSIAVAKKRSAAARAMGALGDPKAKIMLQRAARDKDPRVRDAVAVGLARLGDKTQLIVFRSALNDADEGVRQAAMEALADIADPGCQDIFLKGFSDSAPAVRTAALKGLQPLKNPGVWREVAALLRDGNAVVRESAAETLGILGNREAVPALKPLLNDENGFARIAAARALARLSDRSGAAVLRGFLSHSDADVRVRTAQGLAGFSQESDWSLIVPLLDDPEERVRLAVALAVWKKGGSR